MSWKRPVTVQEMRDHAAALHARADAIMSRAYNRMTSIPSPMVTGSSGYAKNFGKANDRNMTAFLNAGDKAKALREAAAKWLYRADRDDPERIAARAKQAEANAKATATLNEFLKATVKVGDLVHIGGNSPIKVKRVNKNGITSEGGSLWSWGEVRRFPTTAEEMTAYREWKSSL